MSERIAGFEVEHLHGPEEIPSRDNGLVVVCLIRDGEPWVRSFVEHYFTLGARQLVFLDNDSTDDTVSVASEYDDVTVMRTKLHFNANVAGTVGQTLMRRYLIERFGKGRWSLCVDVDELFDYPYSDAIGLDSFLGYLNSKSYTAVMAHMLDMFPESPCPGRSQELVGSLKEAHRFYDISSLERVRFGKDSFALRNNIFDGDEVAVGLRGGIRERIFGIKPWLTKYPLLFSDGTLEHVSVHNVSAARVADLTCVLFHYKFYAFSLQEYWYKAIEYKKDRSPQSHRRYEQYAEVLESNPHLEPKLETSLELSGVNDLLCNGFLVTSEDYISWVDAEEERNFSQTEHQADPDAMAQSLLESRRRERTKALRIGALERQVLEFRRWERKKAGRMRKLRRKLGDSVHETQVLKQQVLGLEQTITRLKGKLRSRGRKLRRSNQKTRRLMERNERLRHQIAELENSRAWKVLSIIHSSRLQLGRLTDPWRGS